MSLRIGVQAFLKQLLLWPLLLALSPCAFAVSLGDELILSALGDPVEVEIEVLQWEDIDLDRVQISAATREEYDVFKLTWLPVLENLNFNLVGPDLNGKVRVLVSSRDPLDEPFLELLLVLRWPGGSLRREYVLLFDPPGAPVPALTVVESPPPATPDVQRAAPLPPAQEPVLQEPAPPSQEPAPLPPATAPVVVATPAPAVVQRASVAPAAVVAPVPEAKPEPEPAPPPMSLAVEEPATPSPAVEEEVPDARTTVAVEVETLAPQSAPAPLDTDRRTYQVRAGDSLWNIARQFRPAGAGDNLYQVLLSIHNLNRNSFINGNISLLKANAVLQVPTVADIERVDALTAEAEFDRRWDQGTQRFEAAQRGDAIPLFAEETPPETVAEIEEPLPPGTEAPLANREEGALIMVSANVPQPLQLGSGTETVGASSFGAADENAEEEAPAPAAPQIQTVTVAVAAPATTSAPAVDDTPVNTSAPVAVVTTRAVVTAELETEVAAMSARRQAAEALAKQLQDSLERARADRAAQASLFGKDNLMLAGSAVVLFLVLTAGIVGILRVAGDLRLMRGSVSGAEFELRAEPRMPEVKVVEVAAPPSEAPQARPAPAAAVPRNADDLFARMDDLLGADSGNSPKTS